MQIDPLRAFPYPVLRSDVDDYVGGKIQANTPFDLDGKTISAKVTFDLSVKAIADLIAKRQASYVVVFACRETFFKHTHKSSESEFTVKFLPGHLRGEVLINSYIIADERITEYKCDLINSEFGPGPFSFEPNSVLALTPPKFIFLDQEPFKHITSFFDLGQKDSLSEHEWQLDVDSNRVKIVVSAMLKKRIDAARSDPKIRIILINSIYFSAVMQCLAYLKKDDTYDNYRWAKKIQQKCHDLGLNIDSDDEHKIAQRLMNYDPLKMLDRGYF